MFRLTRKVFFDLAIWMSGFGLLIGIVFPFFMRIMKIPSEYVFTPWFFVACIAAGILVGVVNLQLARNVVGRRLKLLAERMRMVQQKLEAASKSGAKQCDTAECIIAVDSDDEIGESAQAFNNLVEALFVSHETETAIRTFIEMLASHLEVNTLAEKALFQLLRFTNSQAGALLTETDGNLGLSVSHGIRSPEALLTSDHVRRALRTEEREIVELPEGITMEGVLTEFRPRQVIIEPILYKHVVLGLIILANASEFSAEDQNRLTHFRQGLALALQNALVHERLQRLAALDPLANAYNRRFGMTRLHEEFGRSVRSNSPLGVMIFDIDLFKNVNDTYGHLIGDRALVRITKLVRSVIREGDILIRYGGDEFLAVLPAASKEDVHRIAERLRRTVAENSLEDGNQKIQVTISLGGSSYPELEVENEVDLIKKVDEALYESKEAGCNRVTLI